MRYCTRGLNVRSPRPDTGGVLESGCRFCRCTRSAPHVVVPSKSRSFVAFSTDSHRIKKHCPVFAPSIRGPPPTDTAIALSRRGTHLTNVLSRSPLAVGSTDPSALMEGAPEADSADCGGLAPKEVCGLLAVGHQYPDALGGTLEGR